jgi:hypothetical protein
MTEEAKQSLKVTVEVNNMIEGLNFKLETTRTSPLAPGETLAQAIEHEVAENLKLNFGPLVAFGKGVVSGLGGPGKTGVGQS